MEVFMNVLRAKRIADNLSSINAFHVRDHLQKKQVTYRGQQARFNSKSIFWNFKSYRKNCKVVIVAGLIACMIIGPNAAWALDANALPTGGQITVGAGSVNTAGTSMTVTQTSDKLVAQWGSFNIGQKASVTFAQPGTQSIALNRILGQNPSQILGQLNANGQVFLLNPAGIIFGQTAQVNVGGLVASALNMSDTDFLNGNFHFVGNGNFSEIVNRGQINTPAGGIVAFLSTSVKNEGTINTPQGTTALLAAKDIRMDFSGNGLITYSLEQGTVDAQVENKGIIKADGGLVLMTAAAANSLRQSVVNNTGIIEAHSLVNRNGRIFLDAVGGQTTVAGVLDVSASAATGGQVIATGDRVLVQNGAHLSATGRTGGGKVLVGGSWQGSDPAIHQASGTIVEQGALLEANATGSGNGGTVVAWSDINNSDSVTRAYGTFEAMGGVNGGDGGRIETSGHWLDTAGVKGSAAAPYGKAGEWLFDPYDVTITSSNLSGSWSAANPDIWTPSGNSSTILNTDINTKLNGGTSVTITTGSAGVQSGDITVGSAITKTSGNTDVTLTMRAENSIIQNANISNTGGTGKLNIVLDADYDSAGNGNGIGIILLKKDITTNGGNLSFGTGRTVTINNGNTTVMVGGDVFIGGAAAQIISTNGGNVDVKGEMIIANTNGLTIDSANGNVRFYGVLDSGNSSYVYTANSNITWDNAVIAAKGVTGDGSSVGDTYLATITSRLENSIATTARGNNKSWLGGARVNEKWFWKTGPEGLENSGDGRYFFTQNMSGTTAIQGGTTVLGKFSNWDLTNSWAEPSGASENKLQFAGSLGFWNDLTNNYFPWIDGYLTETNLAASPVTITAGSGTVTFDKSVGAGKALASLNITSTGGIALKGAAVTTEGLQTYNGNVTLGAASTILTQTGVDKDFTLVAGKSISNATGSDANLTIKTTRNIIMDRTYDSVNLINHPSSITSTTGKLNTVLWADSDNNSTGGIYLQQDTSITTNGGNLTMGGGTDPVSDYAVGNGTGPGLYKDYGVYLGSNVALTAAGGNINIHGKSSLGAAVVTSSGVSVTTTGSGTLTIVGDASGSSNGYSQGFNSNNGIFSTKTGNLSITGLSGGNDNTDRYSYGLMVGQFSTTTGNITLTASQGVGQEEAGLWFSSDADTITSTSGDITLNVDDISKGSVFASNQISSTGNIVIAPYTSGRKVVLSATGTTSDLVIDSSFFSAGLKNGFTSVTVGNATAGAMTVGGATTFRDKTTLQSNSTIAVDGAITANENLTLKSGGAISQSKALDVTGTTSITAGTNAVTLDNTSNNFGGVVSVVSAKNLAVVDSNAMTLGAISSTGTVDIATLTNDLTLTKAISTTDTTTSAIQLNAAKSTAAGTATGGNIIVNSGGSVGTGSSGRSTLYSGSVSGSTGLTALIGSATGNFRYNSDETSTNYTVALGSGKYAIYREKPNLTYTADNETLTYGTAPAKTATLSGLQNGDTSAQSITTAATVSVGGTTSTSSNYTAGAHTLTASGAAGGLGYGFNYASGTLTVNQQALTISGLTASNKVYDTNTTATLGGTAAVTALSGDTVTVGGTASGVFADKNVANAKAITVSGNTISGSDAGNYVLAQQSGLTANITSASLTISGLTASNKVYDTNTTATLGGTAAVTALSGDTVTVGGTASGVFADKNVANAKAITVSGNTISGSDAGNYVLAQQSGLTANITSASLTISGLTASNKVYDTNTSATISNAGSLSGVISGDTVNVSNGNVSFADKNAGSGKTVTVTGKTLAGADAGNYVLIQPTGLTANITKANLTVTAIDEAKQYDGLAYTGGNGVIYSGFVGTESSAMLAGILSYTGTSQGATSAGSYVLTPAGLSSINYTPTYANGYLTILPVVAQNNPSGLAFQVETLSDLLSPYSITENLRSTPTDSAKVLIAFHSEGHISEAARRGMKKVAEVGCTSCHAGPLFSNNKFVAFLHGSDAGLKNVTGKNEDDHVFRVPSWRNVATSAPYFHDGSAKTLAEAVTIMAKVQLDTSLSTRDLQDIVAFLETFTGDLSEPPQISPAQLTRASNSADWPKKHAWKPDDIAKHS